MIAFPAVLLVILLALHSGLYLHGAQIAEAGAQEAVEAAQGDRGRTARATEWFVGVRVLPRFPLPLSKAAAA